MMCVGNDHDVREVASVPTITAAMSAGSTLVDHTTASADVARELATSLRRQRARVRRRAGLGRAGRGAERAADGDVRMRRRAACSTPPAR